MRPDDAKFLLRFLLPQLKSEQTITKKILSSVPPDKGYYKPHAESMSALKRLGLMVVMVKEISNLHVQREEPDPPTKK